ncbi:unnamed protein product [Clonostachys rosea]|uniref:Transcription factor domain-containing protein n=1 Tax=Bionectria ochroleuca TaxID=29856 RepID=A0ABY6TZ42_BIOOC|nr:unnamed protein product [Clonostachys rosea]
MAQDLDIVGPLSRAFVQQRPVPVSPDEGSYFDFFRHATVPGTCNLFPSSFWQEKVMQLAHSEAAIWHATAALGALHQRSEIVMQSVGGHEIALLNEGITHYVQAMALAKGLDSPTKVAILSITLVAIAGLLERWPEMHTHIMACFKIIQEHEPHTPSFKGLLGSLLRSDLHAMTLSDSQSPYPYEESSIVFAASRFLASPAGEGDSYEELASELFGLGRAWFLLDDGTLSANAFHGPWMTNFDAFLRRLALWEAKMGNYERNHSDDNDLATRLSIRLYHVIFRIVLRGTSFGPETRFDALLGYFEYAIRLVMLLRRKLATANVIGLTLEPGVIVPLWIVCQRCRHPSLRRAALKLLTEANRVEGVWPSRAAAAVLEAVVALEEESLGPIDVGLFAPTESDTSFLPDIPWIAWSKPQFDLPTTQTWANMPVIPEEKRVRDVLGSKRVADRQIDLRLLMSSGDSAQPYGMPVELTVSY